jgi:hypothetical protein
MRSALGHPDLSAKSPHPQLARRLRWAMLAYAALLVGPAAAEEVSDPLTFEVRPSGVEETGDQKLDRRLREREAMFRSICIRCGTTLRSESNAPFNPYDALSSRPRPAPGANRASSAPAAPGTPAEPE